MPGGRRSARARTENSKHVGEEEREALPDFRKSATAEARERLAVRWTEWRMSHQPAQRINTDDKDADSYIEAHAS